MFMYLNIDLKFIHKKNKGKRLKGKKVMSLDIL